MTCSSSNRCCSTSCDTCRWRYSGRIARRILPHGRRIFTVEIELGQTSFRSWASSARNVIEYRRSQSRWWNELTLTVWLCRDQRARGILALGSVQEAELCKSFERWPTTLGPVAPENVRAEVYRALHPARIAIVPSGRRYQSISFSVGPRRSNAPILKTEREPIRTPIEVAPMPFLF